MAESKQGAMGNVVGTLVSKEVIATKKDPKKFWIKFELQSGKSKIRGKSFTPSVVSVLNSFVEGEEVGVWGKLESDDYNDKIYTGFTALKVHEESEGAETAVRVTGKVLDFFEEEYANALIVDITDDPKFGEKFVKLDVPKKSSLTFVTDDVVDLKVEAKGQYGNWTVVGKHEYKPRAGSAPAKPKAAAKTNKETAAAPVEEPEMF